MINDAAKTTSNVTEIRELSLDEMDDVSGAGIVSFIKRVAGAIKDALSGPGDVRRPTDRPN